MNIELVYADITKEETDAVVNAANDGLYAGAGVCGAIHSAAGPQLEAACKAIPYRLLDPRTGEDLDEEAFQAEVKAYQQAEDEFVAQAEAHLPTVRAQAEAEGVEVTEKMEKAWLSKVKANWKKENPRPYAAKERCPEGDAVATPGFDLTAEWCIHAVGPVWRDGESGEVELLDSCHRAIIRVADELGAKSVSLPAISTGIFGFSLELAAPTAVNALREAGENSGVETVRITVIDRTNYNAFAAALGLPLEEEDPEPVIEASPMGMGMPMGMPSFDDDDIEMLRAWAADGDEEAQEILDALGVTSD